jgi:hypothetical protein
MLTLFTWGYWGWGSTTNQLVEAVDATEAARGYKHPVFVDIRIRRNVRAKGFSGGAFEKMLGDGRYIWERRLGNANVAAGRPGIKIADPSAAKSLLDTAAQLNEDRQRVIFFCSCEHLRGCHRESVADLVLQEAKKHGLVIEIVERPGNTPAVIDLEVPPSVLAAVARGRRTVPLSKAFDLSEQACLAWGSVVTLISGERSLPILTGPAIYQSGWALPVLEHVEPGMNSSLLKDSSERLRRERGLEARHS